MLLISAFEMRLRFSESFSPLEEAIHHSHFHSFCKIQYYLSFHVPFLATILPGLLHTHKTYTFYLCIISTNSLSLPIIVPTFRVPTLNPTLYSLFLSPNQFPSSSLLTNNSPISLVPCLSTPVVGVINLIPYEISLRDLHADLSQFLGWMPFLTQPLLRTGIRNTVV